MELAGVANNGLRRGTRLFKVEPWQIQAWTLNTWLTSRVWN